MTRDFIRLVDEACRVASREDGGEWSHDAEVFGPFDCSFYCPDGHAIEPDGACPDGHVSPLRRVGLI